MRFQRLILPGIIIVVIWAVLTISPLLQTGIPLYFFEPETGSIIIDASVEQMDLKEAFSEFETQKLVLIVGMDENFSIRVSSPITIKSSSGFVLDLSPGNQETFCYKAEEAVEFSIGRVATQNASFSLKSEEGQHLTNLNGGKFEIIVYYDKQGDPIPIWLSDGATVEISSIKVEVGGLLWVVPQDPLKDQELFRVIKMPQYEGKLGSLSFDSIQGNISFREFMANGVDGSIDADKTYDLRRHYSFIVRSSNPESTLSLSAGKNDTTFRVTSEPIKGQLWIDGIPKPESPLEVLPRSGIASLLSVAVIVLTILLEKHIAFKENI